MPDNTHKTDLLVIGGGPGGYAAAFRAADLGKQVALVEKEDRLGGVCLLKGCIPSKALLHAAALISETREAQRWGIKFGEPEIDLDALRSWKDRILTRHAKGLESLTRQRKVTVIHGRAAFESSQRARIDGNADIAAVEFNHAIVATGSSPATIPGLDLDSPRLLDSTSALELESVPQNLLVIGGGYIGLELGTVYAELGSTVTVVELTDGLLPGADRDLVKPLHDRMSRRFEAIYLNTKVAGMKAAENGIDVTFDGQAEPAELTFSKVLVSVGRRPNTRNLGLENTGVELDARGYISVDTQMRTADEHIFAIGDVVPGPGLAHKATHEGKTAAEVLCGEASAFEARAIPAVVFTDPEVAWCGLTEDQARAENKQVEISRFPWSASGRASTLGRHEGLTKLVIDRVTQRILGVGIVGPGAGELISEGVLAVEMAAVAEDVALSVHPHPTLSESLGIAAELYLGTATDLPNPRKK